MYKYSFFIISFSFIFLLIACGENENAAGQGIRHADSVALRIANQNPDEDSLPDVKIGQHNGVTNIDTIKRRVRYVFYANGGFVAYLTDFTVVGCPRCDPIPENLRNVLNKEPMGTYRPFKNGALLVDGKDIVYPKEKGKMNEWMIFETDEEWEAFINDPDDPGNSPNHQYLLQFLDEYIAECEKKRSVQTTLNWALNHPNVTADFRKALQALIDEEKGWEYDPILDAQDYPDDGFSVRSIGMRDHYISLSAKANEKIILTTRIKQVKGKWLVDGCGTINIPEKMRASSR